MKFFNKIKLFKFQSCPAIENSILEMESTACTIVTRCNVVTKLVSKMH